MSEVDYPRKICISEVDRLIEKNIIQTVKEVDSKLENIILQLDIKIEKSVTDGLDKYFGNKKKTLDFFITVTKYIIGIAALAAGAVYVKG